LNLGALHIDIRDEQVTHLDEADRYLPATKEILYINDGKRKGRLEEK
jgi:hypothetical protein